MDLPPASPHRPGVAVGATASPCPAELGFASDGEGLPQVLERCHRPEDRR